MVMFNDGRVEFFHTALSAFRTVQSRAKRGNKDVTLTRIEWRNVPAGFVPPKG